MPRFTRDERRQLKALVQDCRIKKLEEQEALKYISSHFGGIGISERSYYKIRNDLKKDAHAQITLLKREEFVLEAHQRVDELKANYRELMALKDSAKKIKDLASRVRSLHDIEMSLSTLTVRLAEMYDALPFVAAVQVKIRKEEELEEVKVAQ